MNTNFLQTSRNVVHSYGKNNISPHYVVYSRKTSPHGGRRFFFSDPPSPAGASAVKYNMGFCDGLGSEGTAAGGFPGHGTQAASGLGLGFGLGLG